MKGYIERAQNTVSWGGRTLAGMAAKTVEAASVVLVETSKVIAPSGRPGLEEEQKTAREIQLREDAEIETTVAIMKHLPRSLRQAGSLNMNALDEEGWSNVRRGATQIGLLRVGFTPREVSAIMATKMGEPFDPYPDGSDSTGTRVLQREQPE